MFSNIHLYIIIGILGSITPVLDKFNLENLEWSDYLFIRQIFFVVFLGLLVFFNKKSLKNISSLTQKEKGLVLLGSIVSIIYVCLIFKTFSLEFGKQAISQVVTVMVITTMIFTFLVDKFYFDSKFSNENYLGFLFLILGIYLLKLN